MNDVLQPNSWIGPYELVFRLGYGGMGDVWAARRRGERSGILVAIKAVHAGQIGSEAATLFLDEARSALALRHRNAVASFDVGREGAYLYLAMELVSGPSLAQLLQRFSTTRDVLPPPLVAYIGYCVADALDHAHCKATHEGRLLQLIHRDVTPHNVLIDVSGRVTLADFGVARTAIQEHQTQQGLLRGKPAYMSPEQLFHNQIDGRSDIFSLGIVLYEAATVQRVFARDLLVDTLRAVARYQPPPVTEMVPGFSPVLSRVIDKMLAKDREKRFQSSAEVAMALKSCLGNMDPMMLERELSRLIERSFPPNTFNLDLRIQAAAISAREEEIEEAVDLEEPTTTSDAIALHTGSWESDQGASLAELLDAVHIAAPDRPKKKSSTIYVALGILLFLIFATLGALSKRLGWMTDQGSANSSSNGVPP